MSNKETNQWHEQPGQRSLIASFSREQRLMEEDYFAKIKKKLK